MFRIPEPLGWCRRTKVQQAWGVGVCGPQGRHPGTLLLKGGPEVG